MIVLVVVVLLVVSLAAVGATLLFLIPPASGPGASRPQITITTSEPVGGNGFRFTIAGVSQSRAAANYRVNFAVEGSSSTEGPQVLSTGTMTFTVSGRSYNVFYTDLGGEGSLTGGDIVMARAASGSLTFGTTYHVLILWSDGAQLADGMYMP